MSSPGVPSLEGQGNLPGSLGCSKKSLAPSRKACVPGGMCPREEQEGTRKGHKVPNGVHGRGEVQKESSAECLGFWEDTLPSAGEQRKKQVSWILECFVLE